MARNPFKDSEKVLGLPPGRLIAAKNQVESFLKQNSDKEDIDESDIRASLSQPVDDRTWNTIKADLGIF